MGVKVTFASCVASRSEWMSTMRLINRGKTKRKCSFPFCVLEGQNGT